MDLQPKGFTVEFDFKELGLVLKKGFCGRARGKKVLDGVTGCIRPGRLTAVMGPSGAGKRYNVIYSTPRARFSPHHDSRLRCCGSSRAARS
jgi:hypothetical protein